MIELKQIQNERLRTLIATSGKWAAFSDDKKSQYLDRITKLDDTKQAQLANFFQQENQKEADQINPDTKTKLKQLYEKLLELEKNFQKLLKADPEKKDQEHDEKEMDNLLDQLEKL